MEIEIQSVQPMGGSKQDVAECLAECMSNGVVLYFKAHGHHWNVKGSDFTEFHKFFAMIAEDVYSSLDGTAENILKLDVGMNAPFRLIDFARMSSIEDIEVGNDAMAMCRDLLAANAVTHACLNDCFKAAVAADCQAIADFIAGRLGMHEKWDWQLKAHLNASSGGIR